MKKKTLGLMLLAIALMMTAVFAGCTSTTATTTTTPAGTTTAAQQDETTTAAADGEGDSSLSYVQDKGTLVLGLDDSFPPMGYRDENKEIVGYYIDLATEV